MSSPADDVLVGAKAIADALSVTPKRVGVLFAAGAPIKRLGEGSGARYFASRAALLYWLRVGSFGQLSAASNS